MRKIFEVERGEEYQRLLNVFSGINTDKALIAMELMRWLNPKVEVDTFKLGCI